MSTDEIFSDEELESAMDLSHKLMEVIRSFKYPEDEANIALLGAETALLTIICVSSGTNVLRNMALEYAIQRMRRRINEAPERRPLQ